MSGRTKLKSVPSPVEAATQSINERILRECNTLYTESSNGLVKIAHSLNIALLVPRKKINILLLGNHSAGKSSFINWYIEEHIQRTGVAIETQGFTFVTSGKKRESLTGKATLHLFSQFEPLCEIEGVIDYLTTEISTSKQKRFSLLTFVDTPGLVDGDMKYPFNVDKAIIWLGDMADLIFVFFDPIGQALCKRTLNLVELLNEKHADKMKFYLSKADEAGHESDRQRVMMQIVQELCKRPGLNRAGFDMPTIYVPSLTVKTSGRCANQIEEVCREIEKTINQTIQNTLNSLETDCDLISHEVDNRLVKDKGECSKNFQARMRWSAYGFLGLLIPSLMLVTFLMSTSHKYLTSFIGKNITDMLILYLHPVTSMWAVVPAEYSTHVLLAILAVAVILLLIAKFCTRTVPTLSRRQKRSLLEIQDYVNTTVKTKKQSLYHEYLRQCVGEHDL